MTCRRAQELLAPMVDGELDDAGTRALRSHLSGCDACSEELRALQQIQSALRGMPQRSCPESVWAGLHERIAQSPKPMLRPQRYQAGMPTWAFGVALVVGIGMISPYTPFQAPSSDRGIRLVTPTPAANVRTAVLPPAPKMTSAQAQRTPLNPPAFAQAQRTPLNPPASGGTLTPSPLAGRAGEALTPSPLAGWAGVGSAAVGISRPLIAARFAPVQRRLAQLVRTAPASESLAPFASVPPAPQSSQPAPSRVLTPQSTAPTTATAATQSGDQDISGMVAVAENAPHTDAALAQAGKDLWSVAVNAPADTSSDPTPGA